MRNWKLGFRKVQFVVSPWLNRIHFDGTLIITSFDALHIYFYTQVYKYIHIYIYMYVSKLSSWIELNHTVCWAIDIGWLPPSFSFYFSILNRIFPTRVPLIACETLCKRSEVRLEENENTQAHWFFFLKCCWYVGSWCLGFFYFLFFSCLFLWNFCCCFRQCCTRYGNRSDGDHKIKFGFGGKNIWSPNVFICGL